MEIIIFGKYIAFIAVYLIVFPVQNVFGISNFFETAPAIFAGIKSTRTVSLIGRIIINFALAAIAFFIFRFSAVEVLFLVIVAQTIVDCSAICLFRLWNIYLVKTRILFILLFALSVFVSAIFSLSAYLLYDCILNIYASGVFDWIKAFALFAFAIIIWILGSLIRVRKRLDCFAYTPESLQLNAFALRVNNTIAKNSFEKKYSQHINNAAKNNGINYDFLLHYLIIEKLERRKIYVLIFEEIICRIMPSIAIWQDMSIGVGQIKISNCCKYLNVSKKQAVKILLDPKESINVSAIMFKTYADEILLKKAIDPNPCPNTFTDKEANNKWNLIWHMVSKYISGIDWSSIETCAVISYVLFNSCSYPVDKS